MATEKPSSPAIEAASVAGVDFRLVHHGEVSSAEEAAEKRGIAISQLAKTLVVRVEEDRYVLVLVPGDSGMDYKKLREHLGVRRLTMPDPDEALAATGYRRGTITPLGSGHPAILDRGLVGHAEISLGSGVEGWAIHIDPADLVEAFDVTIGDVAKG
ncbi:MAG: YbaK/EbsC family protein [Acidimicrobiia bacterium]|nr:YbaK/EbsC family protein [Acidimicrobiia bacterium]